MHEKEIHNPFRIIVIRYIYILYWEPKDVQNDLFLIFIYAGIVYRLYVKFVHEWSGHILPFIPMQTICAPVCCLNQLIQSTLFV